MSAKRITIKTWECVCELPDCPGGGASWVSRDGKLPKRCRWCKRLTWNGPDKRLRKTKKMTQAQLRAYNRQKQAESRERRRKEQAQ